VFISCKSDDYGYAEQVYEFLVSSGKKVFLASREIRKLGDSEYRDVIERALECSTHIIVLASNAEYILSKWVKYEWRLFLNGKLDGTKKGNIITILKDIEPKDIYFGLRAYQSIPFGEYRDSILDYTKPLDSDGFAEVEEREGDDSVAAKNKSRIPEWLQVLLIFIGAFIFLYSLCFGVGYSYTYFFDKPEVNPQTELLNHVTVDGPIIRYSNFGVTAMYDADAQSVRDISINECKFEITGGDFWRAASIGSGFAIWYKNLRYMKASGRYGAAVAIGSFIGTLFGYSTGRYIAEQNNAAEIQAYMVGYLKDTKHWIICQQQYDERRDAYESSR